MTSLASEFLDQETSHPAASGKAAKRAKHGPNFCSLGGFKVAFTLLRRSLDKLGNLKGMHETSSQVDKDRASFFLFNFLESAAAQAGQNQ